MALFASLLAILLALVAALADAVPGPGARAHSCVFGYNNDFYVLGGVGTLANGTIFMKTPYPFTGAEESLNWTSLPDPPWQTIPWVNSQPTFSCSNNRDGKVFLFGNAVGFAYYDPASNAWSTTQPTFKPSVSMSNLMNQSGVASAVWPDGYTISIFVSGPQMYLELDSQNMTMDGVSVPGFKEDYGSFCMDVVKTTPPLPVVCGGSTSMGYSDTCWQLGLGNLSTPFAALPEAQDACSLIAFETHFVVWPGFLSTYYSAGFPPKPINPDMYIFDMNNRSNGWGTIPNVQGSAYLPIYDYIGATVMPNTSTAVLFGGQDIFSTSYSSVIYQFNLSTNLWVTPFPSPNLGPPPGTSESGPPQKKSHVGAISASKSSGPRAPQTIDPKVYRSPQVPYGEWYAQQQSEQA
ncbi:hypothetical protein EMPS_01495 [Entomortierella parvispora]|uniref:Uncharacterized protein n=1 Tax=Entomortierella parvispora TaxID=205924 RepID=A0A9P3H2Y4_9FUNG|nr:hypothetical protein EMPS_01495 [Entomortierella parvispora]